uniref:Uncharacterized protein n=2 Tax=Rhizophora mucronata TaxID=61149 RepID=A0A2P2MU29_RHIMU
MWIFNRYSLLENNMLFQKIAMMLNMRQLRVILKCTNNIHDQFIPKYFLENLRTIKQDDSSDYFKYHVEAINVF